MCNVEYVRMESLRWRGQVEVIYKMKEEELVVMVMMKRGVKTEN